MTNYNTWMDLFNRSGFLQWQQIGSQLSYSFVPGPGGHGRALSIGNGRAGAQATRAVWGARNAEAFVSQRVLLFAGFLVRYGHAALH